MDPSTRVTLLRGLGLLHVAETLVGAVEAALCAPGAAGSDAPYGDTGTSDDGDFGHAVGELVAQAGLGLVEAVRAARTRICPTARLF